MRFSLLLHTVWHLKIKQILYQVKHRFVNPKIDNLVLYHDNESNLNYVDFIEKYRCISDSTNFTFLNILSRYKSWNCTSNGMLWAYNLNYMDWLGQEGLTFAEGERWIDLFINDLPNNRVGLDPYPIALRSINWVKFICQHYNEISEEKQKIWNDSLYSQVKLLERKLEYHLLGNHLLEDLYALFVASLYFHDETLFDKISRKLMKELDEEVLSDGMHYEQSPMYHCILLDRLLDCYNFSLHNALFEKQNKVNSFLLGKAQKMLGHLSTMVYADGSIPLLNDSALGIAPTAQQLFAYAKRLNISYEAMPLEECGYRKFKNDCFESVVDVGDILASYQPGHSHADTFNFELRIDGKPFIVDSGISTYNKTVRRQYERSTAAHNTVTINDKDSSEVWGGFRIGKRARVYIEEDTPNKIIAEHNGFGRLGKHKRSFAFSEKDFVISDSISSNNEGTARFHLAPQISVVSNTSSTVVTTMAQLQFHGALNIKIIKGKISERYNMFREIDIIEVKFKNNLVTEILHE